MKRRVIMIIVCMGISLGLMGWIRRPTPPRGPNKPLVGVWRGPRFPFASCRMIPEGTRGQLQVFADKTFEFDLYTDVVCGGLYELGSADNHDFIDIKAEPNRRGTDTIYRYSYHIAGEVLTLTSPDGDDYVYTWQPKREPSRMP